MLLHIQVMSQHSEEVFDYLVQHAVVHDRQVFVLLGASMALELAIIIFLEDFVEFCETYFAIYSRYSTVENH